MVSGVDHHRHDPGRVPVIIGDGTVIKIHPDVFGDTVTQQHQGFVVIGQGPARKADIHHMPIEFGDLWPTQFHRGTQQVRMAPTGKPRVGIVIDHVTGSAPQHHHRQR